MTKFNLKESFQQYLSNSKKSHFSCKFSKGRASCSSNYQWEWRLPCCV